MLELYGITGLPENDPSLTGGLTPQTITGYSQLGRQATNPQFQNPFNFNPRVSLTNILGRHSVKVGFEYLAVNTEVQDTNPLYGLDTYSSQFSRPAGAAANNQYNLADFYFGARTQYELASLIVAKMRQRATYAYVQDDFTVSPKLTLNVGLRYEFVTPYYEAENRLSNFDPNATLAARRPIQGFGTISAVLPEAFSDYHALQAKVEYRSSANLNVLNSFTWSKAMDNVSQVLEEPNGSTGTPQNVFDIQNEKGLSAYDVPFLNVTSFVWNLPVGSGRKFGSNLPTVLDAIVGGWQISGIHTMRSGRTVNLRYNTSGPTAVTSGLPSFLGGVALRPNITGDPLAPEDERSIDNYFNRNNITLPTALQPFGNAGRNIVRGYAFYQFDLGLQKRFPLPFRDGGNIEIRAEAFNVLNKTNFGAPNGDRSSGAFGTIRSTFPARQIQFAAKVTF